MAEDPPPKLYIERTTDDDDISPTPSDPLRSQFARGFTITITNSPSAPKPSSGPTDHSHLSVDSPMGSDIVFPPLDRTESRLPSLTEMLADEQLRDSVLSSETEEHKAFQKAILEKSEQDQFTALLSLVRDAYESEEFRLNAANDARLTDTIVLYIKQRCHSLYETLFEYTDEFPDDIIGTSIVSMALLVAVLKFSRNIVAASESMALYLHDHRLADLLLMNLNVFLLIDHFVEQLTDDDYVPSPIQPESPIVMSSQAADGGLKLSSKFEDIRWAIDSLENHSSGRALVQLLANLVSRAPKQLCPHLLPKVFPPAICSLCSLTQDADLVCCLLHQLCKPVPPPKLFDCLVSDSRASQAWYGLLSQCWHQFHTYKRSEKENEWISLLCAFFLKQHSQYEFVGHLLQSLEIIDPTAFYGSLIQHVSPPGSPGRPLLRRASTLQSTAAQLPPSIGEAKSAALFVRDPRAVIDLLLQIIATLVEAEWDKSKAHSDPLPNLTNSPILWDLIVQKFVVLVDSIREVTSGLSTPSPTTGIRRRSSVVQRHRLQRDGGSFKEYQRLAVAVCGLVSTCSPPEKRKEFYEAKSVQQLLQLTVECLEVLMTLHEQKGPAKLNTVLEIVDRKRLVLMLGNMCHENPEAADSIADSAASVLNKCGGRFGEEPGLEEAATFCIKTLSNCSDKFKESFAKARQ